MKQKPKAAIIGANGNIFNILGIAMNALIQSGYKEEAEKLTERVFSSESYDEALAVITEYVEPVSVDGISELYDESYNEMELS